MSMKIERLGFSNKNNSVSNKKKSQIFSDESALVSLSDISDTINSEISCAEVPFDSAKVQEIKNAIAEGHFKINTDAIAEKILNMACDLIATK